jgi:hypothetical protein
MSKQVFVLALLLLAACTRPEKTQRVLEAQGLKDIEITGYRLFGCDSGKGSDDGWHTGFKATAPNGTKVTGVVCEGLLKGATIRYD